MKNSRFYLSIVLLLLGTLPTYSAISSDEETNYLHLDKSFYVTGEIIWYKLYLGASFKDKPVTVRATVADQAGTIVGNEFLKTEGKSFISGYYKIPFDADTGQYLLQLTGASKSDGSIITLAEVSVPIYNDLQAFPKLVNQETAANNSSAVDLSSDLQVSINLPKTTFKSRANVAASIKVTDQTGNPVASTMSITVLDKELLKEGIVSKTEVAASADFEEQIYIKGKAYDQQGQPLDGSIIGAFSGNDGSILYSKVTDGDFILKIPEFQGKKPIQFLGDGKKVDYIDVKTQQSLAYKSSTPPTFNDDIATYLTLSRQRKKIFQHYTALESDLQVTTLKNKLSKRKPHQSWNIKEYEYFEYMYIFFKENLSPLRFKFNSDSTYTASMYNPSNQSDNKFFSGKPLFIIDNVATRDADYVARMRMEDIKTVELFFRLKDLNRYFKLFGSSGVVMITTYNPLNKLPVQETRNNVAAHGLQPKADFPAFTPQQVNGLRQPFFRPQVYWNPNVVTNKTGTAAVNWHQTDDRSTFVIQVVVQGEDGRMGFATKEFTVE